MSIAIAALIATGSLVLSVVVHRVTLIQDSRVAVGMAIVPGVLTLLSAVGLALYRRQQRRKGLTLRPALVPLIVWSVVGVPVLAIGGHLIPYLLSVGDEYSQAGIAMVAIFLTLHGWWIAALISTAVAVGIRRHDRASET